MLRKPCAAQSYPSFLGSLGKVFAGISEPSSRLNSLPVCVVKEGSDFKSLTASSVRGIFQSDVTLRLSPPAGIVQMALLRSISFQSANRAVDGLATVRIINAKHLVIGSLAV